MRTDEELAVAHGGHRPDRVGNEVGRSRLDQDGVEAASRARHLLNKGPVGDGCGDDFAFQPQAGAGSCEPLGDSLSIVNCAETLIVSVALVILGRISARNVRAIPP